MEYPKFKVCVTCCTFNHSKFITDTMNGFTMQQTNFPFVCCIIDDASPDGEQEVIKKYVEEHFDMSEGSVSFKRETDYAHIIYAQHKENKNCYFAVLLLKENLYSQKKGKLKLKYISEWRDSCEYEALCEGDDYWINSEKLQKQAEFLDYNKDYGMCYTQCQYYYQLTGKLNKTLWGGPYETFEQFMKGNTVPTLTTMIRLDLHKRYYHEINPASRGWLMGDYPLCIWFSHESKIKFMPFSSGVYRVLPLSASHNPDIKQQIRFSKSYIDIRRFFENYFNFPEGTYVDAKAFDRRLLYLYAINHHMLDFLKIIIKSPTLLLNIKVLGYLRYFICKAKNSAEV